MAEHPRHPDDLAPLGDAVLVHLAQQCMLGDAAQRETARRCVSVVVIRHRDLIRVVVAGKVPRDAVDEVESDVFLRFARKVYSGDGIINPAGLLVQMAKFARADYLERQSDGVVTAQPWDDAAEDPDLDAAATAEAVRELLSPLDDRQRDIVYRRIVEGHPSAEVAVSLGTTPGNIDVIVHRALARMRKAAT